MGDEDTTEAKSYDVAVPIPCGVANKTYVLLVAPAIVEAKILHKFGNWGNMA
jgi:hypothetical protein